MNISFGRIGRISAVICFCFILVLSLWQCFVDPANSLPLGLYEFFITAPILGVIELPFCFSCGVRCAAITKFISRVTGYWAVRAVIYIGLSAAGYAIYAVKPPAQNGALISMLIWLDVISILFLIALCKKEPNPATADNGGAAAADTAAPLPVSAKPAPATVAAPAPASTRWNPFSSKASESPADAAASKPASASAKGAPAAVGATAPSVGDSAPPSKQGNSLALMDNPFK